MSSDVERRLRDLPGEFPRPDEAVTRRVQRRVQALPRQLRHRSRTAMLGTALLVTLCGGIVLGHWAQAAPSETRATVRSIDVTLLCETVAVGGWREVKASGWPRRKAPGYATGGSLSVRTGPGFGAETLVSIASAHPDEPGVGGVYHHRTRCSRSLARIPLTQQGLPAPPETHGTDRDCRAPRRVVVRIRAVLRNPGAWAIFGEKRELRGIRRNVVTAAVAVRTWPTKKPLSLATIDARGIARLWTAYGCA